MISRLSFTSLRSENCWCWKSLKYNPSTSSSFIVVMAEGKVVNLQLYRTSFRRFKAMQDNWKWLPSGSSKMNKSWRLCSSFISVGKIFFPSAHNKNFWRFDMPLSETSICSDETWAWITSLFDVPRTISWKDISGKSCILVVPSSFRPTSTVTMSPGSPLAIISSSTSLIVPLSRQSSTPVSQSLRISRRNFILLEGKSGSCFNALHRMSRRMRPCWSVSSWQVFHKYLLYSDLW